jgi:hypothetical protein
VVDLDIVMAQRPREARQRPGLHLVEMDARPAPVRHQLVGPVRARTVGKLKVANQIIRQTIGGRRADTDDRMHPVIHVTGSGDTGDACRHLGFGPHRTVIGQDSLIARCLATGRRSGHRHAGR